ncbi:protein containing ATP-binding region, ATPase-like protein, partial [Candidatus Magnetomorum sp. HK-1]
MENFLFSNTKKENSLFSDTNKSDQNDSLFFSDTEKTNSASKYFFETIKYNPRADSATDKQPDSFWKVLIVDDESDIHTVTKISLKNFDFKGKKVKLLHAFSAMDAKEILRKNPDIALVLLDVVMEKNNAGLELVQYLRNELSNPFTRVVLRTGQPGQAPEKDVVDLYEIDDYKLKTELTIEKLLSVVTTSLRNFDIFMEIENNRKDFDKQVKDRTKDLEHKKNELEKAQQIAKSIDEGEENFLENMSYEIRTPLYSVIGLTELLASNENIDDSQKEIIDVILSSGDNIISIIDDIIDISKIDDQEFNIKKEPMSLSKCLEKNLKVLNSTAAKKKIILTQNIAPGVPDGIICDEVRLSQIIINLVSNAIKFSDHGTVDILVKKQIDHSALSTDNNSINLEISVTDQGIGIPSEKIDCLFKRFSQTDVSTFRNFGGTGLGLAISKKLCELMGGKIWVESIPEKGSTFYFTINTSEVKNI